jgi:hypothetical protein
MPNCQHRLHQLVVAGVGVEAQLQVGFDRVGAGFLQAVGADLVDQADAAAFLAQVEQDAAAFGGDFLQRAFELGAAVAALREHHVAGQAFRVDARQRRLAAAEVAQRHGQVFLAGRVLDEGVQRELRPRRRQGARGGPAGRTAALRPLRPVPASPASRSDLEGVAAFSATPLTSTGRGSRAHSRGVRRQRVFGLVAPFRMAA